MPGAAAVHDVAPLASRKTPKSLAAYRSPLTSSRATSVIGMSPRSYERSTHVAVPAPGLYVTSNTWPGVAGVLALKPLYEIQAWFALAGSMLMPLTKRFGALDASES